MITFGGIELFTDGNDKPLLTILLSIMFFSAGIFMLASAYKRCTEIYENTITITTKYYLRNNTVTQSYPVQDLKLVGYFEGTWSGNNADPRSHIFFIFNDGKKIKIDSEGCTQYHLLAITLLRLKLKRCS